ncbi:MAG: hypothetical protein EON93_22930 [Burkholderiales bacterium]|nr:MAG: hypothetical protein EON93_22930 [Burkholderiales bacterium]
MPKLELADKACAVAWVLFSPLAALMALISTVEPSSFYYVQLTVLCTWSVLGVTAGLASLMGVLWAIRLRLALALVAACYWGFAVVTMVGFAVAYLIDRRAANALVGWTLTALILLVAVFAIVRLRSRKVAMIVPTQPVAPNNSLERSRER